MQLCLQLRYMLASIKQLSFKILYLSNLCQTGSDIFIRPYFIELILLLLSFVNWHFTLRLEHSEQELFSVASHWEFSAVFIMLP